MVMTNDELFSEQIGPNPVVRVWIDYAEKLGKHYKKLTRQERQAAWSAALEAEENFAREADETHRC